MLNVPLLYYKLEFSVILNVFSDDNKLNANSTHIFAVHVPYMLTRLVDLILVFLFGLQIRWEKNITLGEPPGFLHSWWWWVWLKKSKGVVDEQGVFRFALLNANTVAGVNMEYLIAFNIHDHSSITEFV